jgi:hypothetical protein
LTGEDKDLEWEYEEVAKPKTEEIKNKAREYKDLEWEYDEVPKPKEEEIKNRPREYMFGTKEETFLWAYETIFNWLGINFDYITKNNFGKQFNTM